MKRMKKLFAILMTMAMVMGLGITGFAANSEGTITVSGLASTGTNKVTYYRILEPDVTTNSGYKFVNGVTVNGYATADAFLADGVTVEQQKAALVNKDTNLGSAITVDDLDSTTFTDNVEAGYYAVFVENDANEGDPEILYTNPMIVSVQYDKATLQENGSYEYNAKTADNSEVVAKYTTIPVTKESTDDDKVVELGDTVSYKIETYIPSEVESFKLTDVLEGAVYDQNSVVIKINNGKDIAGEDGVVQFDVKTNRMIINLSNYLENNAGKKVVITYDAVVTATEVNNTVLPDDNSHKYTSDSEKLQTGTIKLTKYGNDSVGLKDADFVVYKNVGTDPDITQEYLVRNEREGIVSYDWTPTKGDATIFTTDDNGVIEIAGLDVGTYYFEEVEAPSGYSINTNDEDVTIAKDKLSDETTMTDTMLSALPSTGGMGTTLFTIAGCVIMISAAGLFFATRKKAN